uniref:Uncharacterized protein n=1 Tax=Plectus sambesii TaxID=2011161 RepID=A0A914WPH1_9BILA
MNGNQKEDIPAVPSTAIREVVRTEVEPMPAWNDSAAEFYLVASIHCRHAAVISAFLGIVAVVGVFGAAVIAFDWYYFETTVDLIVLTGFAFFLIMGVLVHGAVLQGLQKQRPRYMRPFIIFHVCSLILEVVTALSAVGDLVSDQTQLVERSNQIAIDALMIIPPCICVQVAMLLSVIKCKSYLTKKCEYLARVEGVQP